MAGGPWNSQNKVLPGVYINVQSQESVNISLGERGTVALPKSLSWGPVGAVMEITPGEDLTPYIGYTIADEEALFLREMMKGSDVTSGPNKILLYRLNGTSGAAATVTVGILTTTANYVGTRGNDITVIVTADPDNVGYYDVNTVVDGMIVDSQYVGDPLNLVKNSWVTFEVPWTDAEEYDSTSTYAVGDYCYHSDTLYRCTTAISTAEAWTAGHWTAETATLTTTVGTPLSGGVNPTIAASNYATFLTDIEPYQFDILAYDGTDSTTKTAFVQFINRMNNNIGKKCQLVMNNSGDNNKYVIDVQNGVILNDGTTISAQQAAWWVAGAEAGAQYNQSLTYAQYPGAASANPKLSEASAESAVAGGSLCFIDTFGIVKVCTDIDSKTTVVPREGAEFKKNRVMRVINQFCNDTYEHFSNYFIGKVDNNDNGRALLRTWIIGYLNEMQAGNGIQNFSADDVTVEPGQAIDAVVVNVAIMPVDSIEKVYLTVTVTANGATVA